MRWLTLFIMTTFATVLWAQTTIGNIRLGTSSIGGSLQVATAPNGDLSRFIFDVNVPGVRSQSMTFSALVNGQSLLLYNPQGGTSGNISLDRSRPHNAATGATFVINYRLCQGGRGSGNYSLRVIRSPENNRWAAYTVNNRKIRTVRLDGPLLQQGCVSGVRTEFWR
jgi:hypothetical protein